MYWQTAFLYSITGFIQMLLILLTGALILRILKIKLKTPFKALFYMLCTGMYVWILITACVFTYGRTIILGSIFLIVIILWEYKRISKTEIIQSEFSFSVKNILNGITILAGIWAWTSILNAYCISVDGKNLYLPHFDILHSIEISNYIRNTGTETYYYWQSSHFTFPYHYAEIWLHAAIQTLWNTQKVWTWQNIVMPLLQTTLITGLLAMAETYHKKVNTSWILLACSFILFQGWLNISLPYFDTHFDFTRYISMIGAVKFVVVGIFIILYLLNNSLIKHLILLLLPIFSVLTLPLVLVLVAVEWFREQKRILIIGLLCTFFWVSGFYFITSAKTELNISLQDFLPAFDTFFLQTQLYFGLVSIVFYLPVFFYLQKRRLLLRASIVFTVNYLLFFIFYRWYDSYQFLVLFWIPLLWGYSWQWMLQSLQKHFKIMFYSILMVSFIQTFLYKKDFQRTAVDNVWIDKMYNYLTAENIKYGAALWYYDSRQSHIFCWQKNEIKVTSLLAEPVVYDGITQKYPEDRLAQTVIQRTLPFQPDGTQSLERQIIDFCKQNKIQFLIYPTAHFSFSAYSPQVSHQIENKKDKLNCIVLKQ